MNIERRWIFKNINGKFIGTDAHSGGYPYDTDLWNARKFHTFEDACKYAASENNWTLLEITHVIAEPIEKLDIFEIELAALKKKHGRA